jgi:hypothetical protein
MGPETIILCQLYFYLRGGISYSVVSGYIEALHGKGVQ